MKHLEVVVGVPSGEDWHKKMALSLIGLVVDFTRQIPGYGSQQLRVFDRQGSILPQSRQQLMDNALKANATHLLFIDSDQSFPPDTLRRLLAWNVPVVGCNIATKRFPSHPTARTKDPTGDERGLALFTKENDTGLERVWRVGTGVMLIDLSIVPFLGPRPWFNLRWKEKEQDFEGEDWFFCSVVERAGYHIYVDQGLSYQIGHWGQTEFRHDFVIAAKLYDGNTEQPEVQEVGELIASD